MTRFTRRVPLSLLTSLTLAALSLPGAAAAQTADHKRCLRVERDSRPATVALGKSSVIPLHSRVARILVSGQPPSPPPAPLASPTAVPTAAPPSMPSGAAMHSAPTGDGVADMEVMLLSPTDLFFRGKKAGSMNVIMQNAEGVCFIKDIVVTVDPSTLQGKIAEVMPDETRIRVGAAENALVLSGEVSDAQHLGDIITLANAYGGGKQVVNLLRTTAPQQVMLEVKIAEVSKKLLDKLGASIAYRSPSYSGGMNTYSLLSNFLSNGAGLIDALRIDRVRVNVDAQKDDGLVRILAEPNVMAISGQQASFLSGGKIFIPVAQSSSGGAPVITLEEKEFGIGVKFTPTVLGGNRVHLKMVSEVSDLSQTGSPFTSVNGVTSILPSLSIRRADTTVQLGDGQSFVIAGLLNNSVTQSVKRFPGLGEIPVIGALARSTEFQNDQTELLFVITPRLVKPLSEVPRLPTDNHVVPSRAEVYLNGALESATPPADAPLPQIKSLKP